MAFTQNPFVTHVKQPQAFTYGLSNSDGTNTITGFTAGVNGSKLFSIMILSSDSAAHAIQFAIASGGTNYILGTAMVPANAGVAPGQPQNVEFLTDSLLNQTNGRSLAPYDNDGQPYLFIPASANLVFTSNTAITAATNIFINGIYGDF